jgi:hypothetical protein
MCLGIVFVYIYARDTRLVAAPSKLIEDEEEEAVTGTFENT